MEFKRKFPNLDHGYEYYGVLFPRYLLVEIPDGPPLIREGTPEWAVLTDLSQRSEPDRLAAVQPRLWDLSCWAWTLYKELGPDGDRVVSDEQAELWLGDVEDNLCMVLETIDFSDRRQALCALAHLMQLGLEHVVVLVEGIRGILQGAGKPEREKGEPGRVLTRLEQTIEIALSERGPGLKRARSTQGPENYEGGAQQGGDCCQQENCQAGPDQRGKGGANLAACLESPDLE